ncbi:cation-dependent mannose-6-phosphate receptor-like [Uloborus diversus]|uniref:cation-dependent mannose-6-phosphate receptor-like n=1 Tax=Uloborus diversus TaxID=327109 RepID=UPI00240945A3|nr:cation-dependent mannose-6-phosphate receptor-like [Uloborus diversus]
MIKAVDNYTYYYNPCFAFSLGNSDSECAKGVAVCQVSSTGEYFDCGDQDHVHFSFDSATNTLHMIYTSPPRTTNVTLVCDSEAYEPELDVTGENPSIKNLYEMTLTSRCACPNLCRESHLSAGSVLVIIFMIFVSLYLFLGIIHSNLTRGAQGWELLPHYEFWSDFPLLVRDGCVFVVNGCKTDTGYDRI